MSNSSTRSNQTTYENIPVKNIVYYQKPIIGDVVTGDPLPPVQLVFPGGNFGLAIPVKDQTDTQATQGNYPVVSSGPENTPVDLLEKESIKCAFVVVAFFNLVITCLMYANAHIVDVSRVEYPHQSFPTVFEIVSTHRSYTENVQFGFFLTALIIGISSAYFEIPLGLSAYAFFVVVNFLLGTSALPYFVYSLRYIFDVFLLYLALVLRSRLMYTFLPARVHRIQL